MSRVERIDVRAGRERDGEAERPEGHHEVPPDTPGSSNAESDDATARLFEERYSTVARMVDGLFVKLLVVQWVVAVALSLWLSPRVWAGSTSAVHSHVFAAVVLGGLISALPIYLARRHPGEPATRYVIASAQMLWGALLIHLTGGRIETHFHIFGSLAIIAFYRDMRVLIPATIIVTLDHFVRGLFWPESVYGVASPEWWRFLEHTGWVLFIDLFLLFNCRRSYAELWGICRQQVELRASRKEIASRRHFLENVLTSVSDALFIVDPGGRISMVNDAAARLLKRGVASLVGSKASEHGLSGLDVRRFDEGSTAFSDAQLVSSNGERHPVSLRVGTIESDDGRPQGWVIVAHDLSDLKRRIAAECAALESERRRAELEEAYAQLERTHRSLAEAQSALIAASRQAGIAEHATNVLHNVGNVLNNVNVAATVVQQRLMRSPVNRLGKLHDLLKQNEHELGKLFCDPARADHFVAYIAELERAAAKERQGLLQELQTIRTAVDHIKQIVTQQQRSARSASAMELVDPRELLESVIAACSASAEAHGIEIESTVEAQPFRTDPHKVLQILINLVTNARQALVESDARPKVIRVSASANGTGRVQFTVSDNGIGMSDDTQAHLFEHGFTTKRAGSGFGLHASSSAARELRGSLYGGSAGVGQGSTFVLEVPENPEQDEIRPPEVQRATRDAA